MTSISYKEFIKAKSQLEANARKEHRILSQHERVLLIQYYDPSEYIDLEKLANCIDFSLTYLEPLLNGLELKINRELADKKREEARIEKLKKNRKLKEFEKDGFS